MWKLYQLHGSYAKVAKLTRRDHSTVARYVSEYETAVRMTNYKTISSKESTIYG